VFGSRPRLSKMESLGKKVRKMIIKILIKYEKWKENCVTLTFQRWRNLHEK